MRKKAERKIRAAAALLGEADAYRIDRVREQTDLIRKVFDKTLLDMARVGTAELIEADPSGLDPAETAGMIRHADHVYGRFRFTTPPAVAETEAAPEPETINIIIKGVDRSEWRRFDTLCTRTEGKRPADKIREWVRDYIQDAP